MARELLYGITSDMRMIVGYQIEEDTLLDTNNIPHPVASIHKDYNQAMQVLLHRYNQWTIRMHKVNMALQANIANAHNRNPYSGTSLRISPDGQGQDSHQ